MEYVLKVKPKKAERAAGAKEVSLTLVDTPGLGDTYGNEQDARNLVPPLMLSYCVIQYSTAIFGRGGEPPHPF